MVLSLLHAHKLCVFKTFTVQNDWGRVQQHHPCILSGISATTASSYAVVLDDVWTLSEKAFHFLIFYFPSLHLFTRQKHVGASSAPRSYWHKNKDRSSVYALKGEERGMSWCEPKLLQTPGSLLHSSKPHTAQEFTINMIGTLEKLLVGKFWS